MINNTIIEAFNNGSMPDLVFLDQNLNKYEVFLLAKEEFSSKIVDFLLKTGLILLFFNLFCLFFAEKIPKFLENFKIYISYDIYIAMLFGVNLVFVTIQLIVISRL